MRIHPSDRLMRAALAIAILIAFMLMVAKPSGRPILAQSAGPRDVAAPASHSEIYHLSDAKSDTHVEYHQVTLDPGKEIALGDLRGPGLITYFYITDDAPAFDPGLVLKIFWDGKEEPSVFCPLGDFFGEFDGRVIDYESAYMQVNHRCYMCYLPMPFARSARFVLANDGTRRYSQSMAWGIDFETSDRYVSEAARLNCAWTRSNPVQNGIHTLLRSGGAGNYVGNFYSLRTFYKGWWGEGDTIFNLDGRKITHTPGTEDEYGSCWGFGKLFQSKFCGYIESDPPGDEPGRNRMYRWYARNPVRFHNSLEVQVQDQHWVDATGQTPASDDVTSVAFWYSDPPSAPALASYGERTAPSKPGK